MASSYGRGSFSAGPSSSASSSSVESDNDTDLDSEEAELHLHLPSLGQQLPEPSPRQFIYPPARSSSLSSETKYDYGDVRAHPSQQHHLSGEDKQFFDHFWRDFHEKRRQRQAQAPDPYMATERGVGDIMNGRYYSDSPYNARAYQYPRQRQPLVSLIRNKWQTDSRTNLHSGWSNEDSPPSSPTLNQVLLAPRPRRWLLVLVGTVIFLFVYWRRHGAEAWHEHQILSNAVEHRMRSDMGFFGTNMLPDFVGMTQVRKLDVRAIPGMGDNKRLIIVGDVHGCVEELQTLLATVDFKLDSDHLVFAGDLVSKGPSSTAAVDIAMASQASCVRGNHEDRVLLAYRDLQIHHSLPPHPIDPSEVIRTGRPPDPGNPKKAKEAVTGIAVDEFTDNESFLSGDHVDQVLAKSFSKEQIKYLASCPVILDVGPIVGMGEVRVVHAGLVPGVSLHRQDPISVMQMRTIDLETHVPSHVNDGTPWTKIWNKYQSFLPKKERSTIIYGHDSKRGLQLGKYTKGIDTGCVKGGKLTALILTSGNNKNPKTVSVDCKDYRPKHGPKGEELGQS